MTDFRDSVVRLFNRVGDRPSWGSGIFVSPSLVLTAAHVVAAPDADGRTPAPREQIEIESAGFSGRQRPDFIEFAKASDIDLALLSLRAPKGVSPDFVTRVNAEPLRSINIGDEVTACGFASIDGARQTDRLRVLGIHGNAGALICNKAVPEGYSGGPIFADGLLVGIMYARNLSQGQSYFHGGQALMEVLNAYARELSWVRDAPSPLRAYPLTPGIGANEILMRLARVIDAAVRLYPRLEALLILAEANAARTACGPDSGTRGLVEVQELPDPMIALRGFWIAAFVDAGLKSPRMLAALLIAVDGDGRLGSEAHIEKEAALRHLASLPRHNVEDGGGS